MLISSLQSLMFREMEFSELNVKVELQTAWLKNNNNNKHFINIQD